MKIKNNKIIEATESELMKYYLKKEYDDIMSFTDYMDSCKRLGTKIIVGDKNE